MRKKLCFIGSLFRDSGFLGIQCKERSGINRTQPYVSELGDNRPNDGNA
jgi:hypothetical protein